MAVYFPRGQQDFTTIKAKFIGDLAGAAKNTATGIAFVTNQELRLAERAELQTAAGAAALDLFHLERITAILDKPNMAGIRKQFLGIDHTKNANEQGGINVVNSPGSIVTNNQTGDNTIYNISASFSRRLTQELKEELISRLNSLGVSGIAIRYEHTSETAEFAQQIKQFLADNGFQVNLIPVMMSEIARHEFTVQKHPVDPTFAKITIGSIM
jgi:hypothetical protein